MESNLTQSEVEAVEKLIAKYDEVINNQSELINRQTVIIEQQHKIIENYKTMWLRESEPELPKDRKVKIGKLPEEPEGPPLKYAYPIENKLIEDFKKFCFFIFMVVCFASLFYIDKCLR